MHGHLSWLVELDIKEGQFEAAHALMEEMVEHTAKEPTSHTYDWYISDDRSVAAIYERYEDPEAAHSHLRGFLDLFVERFVSIFDASRFVVYGSPHDDLKADLEAWNPVYLSYWGGFRR